jgi:hypothetical protein
MLRAKGTNSPEPYTREEQLTKELMNVLGGPVVPKAITPRLALLPIGFLVLLG